MIRRLTLAGFLVALAAWVGLLLWASTERLHVVVIADGDQVTGTVGPVAVSTAADGPGAGQIGFYLQGADPYATVTWPVNGQPRSSSFDPTALLYRLGAETAWTNVKVTNLDTGRVLYLAPGGGGPDWRPFFGDWFGAPLGGQTTATPGLALVGSPAWRNYRIDADVLRPRAPAGILVRSTDGSNGLLFFFRVEDRDAMWFTVTNGGWYGPSASAAYRAFTLPPVDAVQDVLRLLLGGLPGAAAFLALIYVVATVERARSRRFGYETPRLGRDPGFGVGAGASWTDDRRRARDRPAAPHGDPPTSNPGGERSAGAVLTAEAGAWPAASAGPDVDGAVRRRSWPPSVSAFVVAQFGAVAIVLAGLALTLDVADSLLQRMPHVQDSVAYLFQAKTYALGRLWVPLPPHPQFFVHEFIVMTSDGRWFGKYPPGWPMLLALGVLAGAPWVVDPICGALCLGVLYVMGRDIFGVRVGLFAAALGLAAPFWIFLSGSMMSHTAGLLFTLLGVYGLWRAGRPPGRLWPPVLAGVSIGMALLIRPYDELVIVAPFALYCLWAIARRPVEGLKAYVPALVAVLPFVIAFFAYNKVLTGRFLLPPQELWWTWDKVGFGPDRGPWGYYPIDALNNTSRNLSELLTHGFGWPAFLTLSLAVVPFVSRRARTWDWLFLLGFLAVVLGYAFWWADGIMYGPRFYFEGFGFLILLTARGLDVGLEIAGVGAGPNPRSPFPAREGGKMARPDPAPVAAILAVAGVAGLVAFNLAFYLPGQWTLYHGYNYVNHSRLDAVAAAGIHHAVVFADTTSQYAWWDYGMVFLANSPLLDTDVVYARDLGDRQDCELRADYPDRTFWTLTGTTVTPLQGCPPTSPGRGR